MNQGSHYHLRVDATGIEGGNWEEAAQRSRMDLDQWVKNVLSWFARMAPPRPSFESAELIPIVVSADELERLEERAEATSLPLPEVVRLALASYLEQDIADSEDE